MVMGNDNRLIPDPLQLQYNVLEIVKHKGYNATIFTNDIALLFINGYIPWNWPTVKAIRLNTEETAVGMLCKISGWGNKGYVSKKSSGTFTSYVLFFICYPGLLIRYFVGC